jgi:hypothetical protein
VQKEEKASICLTEVKKLVTYLDGLTFTPLDEKSASEKKSGISYLL